MAGSEFTREVLMKFLPAQFSRIDVNVFKAVLDIQRFFNLTEYREVIVKKFTARYLCRNEDLNLILVAATTNGFLL